VEKINSGAASALNVEGILANVDSSVFDASGQSFPPQEQLGIWLGGLTGTGGGSRDGRGRTEPGGG
jgi:hypothetical protein